MKEKFQAVPTFLLPYLSPQSTPLYLFHEGEYELLTEKKKEQLSVNIVFLNENDRHPFITDLVRGMSDSLLHNIHNKKNFHRQCHVLHDIYRYLIMQIRDMRLDEPVQRLVMLAGAVGIELGKQDVTINRFIQHLKHLKNQQNDLFFLHSCLIGFMGQKVLQQMGVEYHIFDESFIYAAYFHDALLSVHFSDIAQILVEREGEEAQVGGTGILAERQKIIMTHAKDTAEMLRSLPIIPDETIKIIRQHHGMLSGIGHSTQIHGRFSFLTSLFILMDDFSGCHFQDMTTKANEKALTDEIMEELRGRYQHKNFQDLLTILSKLLTS